MEELRLKQLYSYPLPSPLNPQSKHKNKYYFPSVLLQTCKSKKWVMHSELGGWLWSLKYGLVIGLQIEEKTIFIEIDSKQPTSQSVYLV